MGKILDTISSDLFIAMKEKNTTKVNALRNIKKLLTEYKTSTDGAKIAAANNGEIPAANEIKVINKYVSELDGDIKLYANIKPDMAEAAQLEKSYLTVYLPKAATEDEIKAVVEKYISENGSFEQKQMGIVVNYVKSMFDNVDGKMAATIIRSYIQK